MTHTAGVNDYERAASELSGSIRLGYEAEGEDPTFPFKAPSLDEIQWLAGWLVSEGWSRSPDWYKA